MIPDEDHWNDLWEKLRDTVDGRIFRIGEPRAISIIALMIDHLHHHLHDLQGKGATMTEKHEITMLDACDNAGKTFAEAEARRDESRKAEPPYDADAVIEDRIHESTQMHDLVDSLRAELRALAERCNRAEAERDEAKTALSSFLNAPRCPDCYATMVSDACPDRPDYCPLCRARTERDAALARVKELEMELEYAHGVEYYELPRYEKK
jgi:hypothetical protein